MKKSLFITQSGIIAALYVALTWVSGILGLSYGSIQFRISEVLTILPIFTPTAIPGLTIGCFISNMSSPYGIIDMLLGSLATLIASYSSYKLKDVRIYNLPVLSALMPVWANAIAVSIIIMPSFSETGTALLAVLGLTALQVAIGEFVCGTILGLIIYRVLIRHNFDKLFKDTF